MADRLFLLAKKIYTSGKNCGDDLILIDGIGPFIEEQQSGYFNFQTISRYEKQRGIKYHRQSQKSGL